MIRRRSLRTRAIKLLVLDEADEMLNKGRTCSNDWLIPYSYLTKSQCFDLTHVLLLGFKEQIYDVYRYLPPATQASCTFYNMLHEPHINFSTFSIPLKKFICNKVFKNMQAYNAKPKYLKRCLFSANIPQNLLKCYTIQIWIQPSAEGLFILFTRSYFYINFCFLFLGCSFKCNPSTWYPRNDRKVHDRSYQDSGQTVSKSYAYWSSTIWFNMLCWIKL